VSQPNIYGSSSLQGRGAPHNRPQARPVDRREACRHHHPGTRPLADTCPRAGAVRHLPGVYTVQSAGDNRKPSENRQQESGPTRHSGRRGDQGRGACRQGVAEEGREQGGAEHRSDRWGLKSGSRSKAFGTGFERGKQLVTLRRVLKERKNGSLKIWEGKRKGRPTESLCKE
jgi:hypothetical protein